MCNLRRCEASVRWAVLWGLVLAVALPAAWSREPVVTVAEGRQLAEHLRIAWRTDLPREPYRGVRALYVDRGRVYVECTYDLLVALDEETGRALWVIKTPGPLDFPPSSYEERLFFFVKDALHQVDRRTGKPLAEPKNPHLGVLTTAGTDGSRVFVTTADGRVHGVRLADVWPDWSQRMDTLAVGSALMPPNRIVIVTQDAQLLSVDGAIGEFRWRLSLGRKRPLSGPGVSNKAIFVAGRDLFVRAFSGGGTELWKTPVGAVGLEPPVAVRDRVFVVTGPEEAAAVAVLKADDGRLLWRRAGPTRFLTAGAKRAYFLVTRKGKPQKVLGYDLDDGKPQGALGAREFYCFASSPATGRFIAATRTGRVYGIVDLAVSED